VITPLEPSDFRGSKPLRASTLVEDIPQENLDATLSKEAQSMLVIMTMSGAKVHVTWNVTVYDSSGSEFEGGYGDFADTPEATVRSAFKNWMRRKNGET